MRYFKLLLLFFISSTTLFDIKAQTDSTINDELRELLINLKRANCTTKFLYNLAGHTSEDSYYTPLNYTDTCNTYDWYELYFDMRNSLYNKNDLKDDSAVMDEMESIQNTEDAIYLGLMDFDFNAIRNDAFDSINYGRWFFYNDDSIWDNANRIDEPFINNPVHQSRGTCNEIFAFSPLQQTSYFKHVNYRFNPTAGNHWFYSNAFSTNILTHPSPHKFQIDFGNGLGYIDVNPFVPFNQTIIYPDTGTYYLHARVTIDGIVYKHSMSQITILTAYEKVEEDEQLNVVNGLKVHVYKACKNTELYKPIIYLSGIDILENRSVAQIYAEMIQDNRILMLKNDGYDIMIVDWDDSKLDISTNAMKLVQLLEYLKGHSDSTEQFVIIGESMGGLIARDAMCFMESEQYQINVQTGARDETKPHLMHNTRLLITLDSPHKGANNPLAFQHAADWVMGFSKKIVRSTFPLTHFVRMWKIYEKKFLYAKSIKQMLIYHKSTRNSNGEYTCHADRTAFVNRLNNYGNDGWPKYAKKMLISNGLLSGKHQIKYNNLGEAQGGENLLFFDKIFYGTKILWVIPIPVIQYNNVKIASINYNGSGNIFHVPIGYNRKSTLRGCLRSVFKRKTTCGFLGITSQIDIDVNNLKPVDILPGGSEYGGETLISGKKDLRSA